MFKLEEGWLTVFLVCALIFVSAAGVEACQWQDGLWTAWATGLLGVAAGVVLAKSRFKGLTVVLFAIVYGLFCVGFMSGFLLAGDWHMRSVEFVTRMGTFILKLIFGGVSRDALPFPVLISTLFWVMGVSGAWMLFRRQTVWPAILPAGLMLIINAYYYRGPVDLDVYVAVYALLALLLLGYSSLLMREREWRLAGVSFSPEMRLDFLRAGLTVALAGTLVAWVTPSFQASPQVADMWQQATGYWSVVRENWLRLFSALRNNGQTATDYYGDTLTLGGPVDLTDTPMMDITVAPLDASQAADLAGVRYYWRAAVFERYANGQWQVGDAEYKEVLSTTPLLHFPTYKLRRDVSAVFTLRLLSTSYLYVVPPPKVVGLANHMSAIYSILMAPDGTVDVSRVRGRDVLVGSERAYSLVGSVSVADEESLRQAGTGYPLWVSEHYLQLPPEITARTRQLARDIVVNANATTPFDQAQAVTNWLRANIHYNTAIAGPPPGTEPVDWLLFTSKEGYCNYYASSEVVMLRSLGVPARLAAGFSAGDFVEASGPGTMDTYHVKQKHAHAWVEVFFPDYGWVEFEPTVSQAPLVRPARPTPAAGASVGAQPTLAPEPTPDRAHRAGPLPPPSPTTPPVDWARVAAVAALVVGGTALLGLLVLLGLLRWELMGWESLGVLGLWVMRARRRPLPSAISALYLRLERAVRWLRLALPTALTPHERAEALSTAVPAARPGVEAITTQYVLEQYGRRPADANVARSAWLAIRFKVWGEGIRRFVRRLAQGPWSRGRRGPA